MNDKTKVHSIHRARYWARHMERQLQDALDVVNGAYDPATYGEAHELLDKQDVPGWARGARVEKAGFFQWAVVLTSHKGH